MIRFMGETGWSLVWTPPTEVVLQIVRAADRETRVDALLKAEAQIVVDLEDLLQGDEQPALAGLRAAAEEGLESYRSGYFRASQALSAATISTAIHHHFGQRKLKTARQLFGERAPEEAGIREIRLVAILGAIAQTLDCYDPGTGRPERRDFNRHASLHRVEGPQYSQANSLTALMLLVALVVEVDGILDVLAAEGNGHNDGDEPAEVG